MDDPSTAGVTEGFGLMFYNARWYDPGISEFAQPDTLIPNLYNSADWNRYSYTRNNPVRYSDPSGHCIFDPIEFVACVAVGLLIADAVGAVMFGTSPDALGLNHAEQYVSNSGDVASTYTAAGIAVQSNYYPLGDIFYRNRDTSGFGYAQASKKEAGKYGDPSDPNVAIAVMQERIYSVTNMCKGKCSQTDIFIAAALAQNGPGFTKSNMTSLLNGKYGTPNTSDPTKAFLPWGNFLDSLDDSSYDRLMLRMFKNDVQALGNNGWNVPDDIDWDYIDDLSQGGWRSTW